MTRPVFGVGVGAAVLVLAPHPDDESLGAGGTIARLSRAGAAVHVLAVCCRCGPMWDGYSDPALRVKEFEAACDTLGVTKRTVAWVGRRCDRTAGQRDLLDLIESGPLPLAGIRPELLLLPAADGFHQDHRAVHRAGIAAARLGGTARHAPRLVLGYTGPDECWTAGGARAVHVDITATWPVKEAALGAYTTQLRPPPHPRNIDAIRALNAASGIAVGVELAEAFVPYRMAC
jgi:LmbE family N-acetylglucosaminyl deacetylase